MSNLWKLIAVAIGAALVACQWTPPHSGALDEARRAFKLASADPLVVRGAPAELQQAQAALKRAELSWIDEHDDALTSHLAYIAFQRVSLARNLGLQREAELRLQRAELESRRLLAKEAPPRAAEIATRVVPVRLQPPAEAATAQALPPAPAVVAPSSTAVETAPAAAAPPRGEAVRVAPKPPLPPRVQAQSARPAKNIASRHDRRERVARAAGSTRAAAAHGARRDPAAEVRRRSQALAQAARKDRAQRRLAASRSDAWYLEPGGRPYVVPPLNPPHPMHWLTSSGRTAE